MDIIISRRCRGDKRLLVWTCCPNGAGKGAKKNILLTTTGKKKQGTSEADMERHLAEGPKSCCDGAMWTCYRQSVKTGYVYIRWIFQAMSTYADWISVCRHNLEFFRQCWHTLKKGSKNYTDWLKLFSMIIWAINNKKCANCIKEHNGYGLCFIVSFYELSSNNGLIIFMV